MFNLFRRKQAIGGQMRYLQALREISQRQYAQAPEKHTAVMAWYAHTLSEDKFKSTAPELETNHTHLEASIYGFVLLSRHRQIGQHVAWTKHLSYRYIDACSWAVENSKCLLDDDFMNIFRNRLMLYSGAGTDTPPPSLKRDIDLLVGLVNMASVNGRITEHRGYHEAIQLNMDFLQDSDTKQFLHTFYNSVGTALSTSLTPILESIEP